MSDTNERPRVLIVDDEQGLADLYGAWLAQEYTTEAVYNGREAIERLADDIDIVLLDRRMPGVSGDEVLAYIRDKEFDCRVAMVSGIEPNLDLLELRIDGYLTKPVEQDALHDLVEDLRIVSGYDEPLQEVHRLATTLSTVEAVASDEDLEASDRYMTLQRRLEDHRQAFDGVDGGSAQRDHDGTDRALLREALHGEQSRGDAPSGGNE